MTLPPTLPSTSLYPGGTLLPSGGGFGTNVVVKTAPVSTVSVSPSLVSNVLLTNASVATVTLFADPSPL